MDIYLWRHGKAEDRSPTGRDSDRRLVPIGERQTRKVAEALLSRGDQPQKIFTSPYSRAYATAEAIQDVLRCPGGVEVLDELASGTSPSIILDALRSRKNLPPSIILVGHMPDLGITARDLMGPKQESVSLGTSTVVKISLDVLKSGAGTLRWILSPADLDS